MKLSIAISCRNESRTILRAIEEAKQLNIDKEIIIIDNGSTDGTQEILKNLKDDTLRIVLKPKNMGLGHTGKMDIQMANAQYLYGPCADLEYRMSDVYAMIKKLEEENLDAVFGSRLLERKDISRWRLIKERPFWLGTIIATFLINKFYRREFTDVIATKLIKTDILKNLGCQTNNATFEFELVSRLCKKGYKIGEIPVYYKPRSIKEGKTMRFYHMIPALWAIVKIKIFD